MRGSVWDNVPHNISPTGLSNLYTMGVVSSIDPRRALPATYTIPDQQTRFLRAMLILEEARETIQALGFEINRSWNGAKHNITLTPTHQTPNLVDIIDGCCDLNYVSIGTLLNCGAPDEAHMALVCKANEAKFPDGVAKLNEIGKFMKPPGWVPPDHESLIKRHPSNIKAFSDEMLQLARGGRPTK